MIPISDNLAFDEGEVGESFIRASGPGGQNVNKVASAVQLRFDVRHSRSLPPRIRERLERLGGQRVSQDGVLVISGRTDEIINRGGDKAAPELIEEVIRKLPEIADAAVFAVPGTDQIWAAVVCTGKLQQKEVLEACRKKLAGVAPSRLIELERIPRNDMGKIIREDLRKAVAQKMSSSLMS